MFYLVTYLYKNSKKNYPFYNFASVMIVHHQYQVSDQPETIIREVCKAKPSLK